MEEDHWEHAPMEMSSSAPPHPYAVMLCPTTMESWPRTEETLSPNIYSPYIVFSGIYHSGRLKEGAKTKQNPNTVQHVAKFTPQCLLHLPPPPPHHPIHPPPPSCSDSACCKPGRPLLLKQAAASGFPTDNDLRSMCPLMIHSPPLWGRMQHTTS